MAIFFTIFIILSLGILAVIIYSSGGSISLSSADFLAKGREAGLSPTDVKALKQAADFLDMEKPLLLRQKK